MYSIYRNVILKIEKKIGELGLTHLSDSIQSNIKKEGRFYRTIARTSNGEKIFFKSLLTKEKGIKVRFLNEINFLKTINKYPDHPLFIYIPEIMDFSTKPSFPFFIYKLLPGESKGRDSRFTNGEIKKIAKLLKIINDSPTDMFSFRPTEFPLNVFSYKKRLNSSLKIIKDKELKKKIGEFISKNTDALKNIKKTLSHGDFSEANIIFFGDNIKLVDWEHVNLRNPLYDFADFWVKRRNYPEEEEILINEYFQSFQEKNYFLKFFKLALLEICLRDISLMQKIIGDFTRKKSLAGVEAVKREKDDYCAIVEKYILSDKEKIYSFKDI